MNSQPVGALVVVFFFVAGCESDSSPFDSPISSKSPNPQPTAPVATSARSLSRQPAAPPAQRRKKPEVIAPLPAPKKAPKDVFSKENCGAVTVDGHTMHLDCQPHLNDNHSLDGVDVIPREAIDGAANKAGGMALPTYVDHRVIGKEGKVRSQGRAPSCTAHAFGSAIDHSLQRHYPSVSPISVLHLWSRYHSPGPHALDTNWGKPIATESNVPYDVNLACAWTTQKDCACDEKGKPSVCGKPVPADFSQKADQNNYARLVHVARVDKPTTNDLKRILARGQDIMFGMKINKEAFRAANRSEHVIADFDQSQCQGAHAMLLAGYKTEPNGTYFLIHNSWGEHWGDHGYAWIHENTLSGLKSVRLVEAALSKQGLPAGIRDPIKPPRECAKSAAIDGATLDCEWRCPDGNAPFAGTCPTNTCDEGDVNLNGQCVPSAPTTRGEVKSTGVKYECNAGGCVYWIPRGQLGCEHGACTFTCPAPAFLLSHIPSKGVFCTELFVCETNPAILF